MAVTEEPSPTAPQLRRLLDAVSPDASDGTGAEIPAAVLAGLAEHIPCAAIGFFEVSTGHPVPTSTQCVPVAANLRAEDGNPQELFLRACRDRAACSPARNVDRTPGGSIARDDAAAVVARYRRSDRQELVVRLADPEGRAGIERRIMLIRYVDDTPFGERDQLVLSLLQPHLTAIRDRVEARRTFPALTARQVELLRHVARGETNRQIGRHLGVTESTVRTHLQHIYARLEAHSRTEAVALASPLLRA